MEEKMLNGTHALKTDEAIPRLEMRLNGEKFLEMIRMLKNDLGTALIAADVWKVANMESLASYSSKPSRVVLFNRITRFLSDILSNSDLPNLEGYYTLNLADRKLALALPLGDCQLLLIIDIEKVEVGLVVNVIIPKIMDIYEEACVTN
jgi:hypothetical protein